MKLRNSENKNILIVLNYRESKSGITNQILELKHSLEKENYEVTLVSTYGSVYQRIKGILDIYKIGQNTNLIIAVGCAYYGFFPMMVAAAVAFLLGKNILYNFHDGQAKIFLEKYSKLVRFVIRDKKIIVASGFVFDVFKKYNFNVVLIPNHFNENYTFPAVNNNSDWNNKILWSRSFEKLYRPELALKVAQKVVDNINCEFHFYGNGSLLENLENEYNIPGIIFHRLIDRTDFLNEYGKYSFYFNTSEFDNFPLSIMEAGYFGLFVLSTKSEGVSSIYNNKEIYYFKGIDVNEISSEIINIFKCKEKFNEYRINLRNKISNYEWRNVKSKWIEALTEAVNHY
jgi:hypothetical protein